MQLNHTPLHRAVLAADIEATRAALDAGADINARSVLEMTALHMAVFGFAKIVERSAYQLAVIQGRKLVQEQIVDLLIERGARVDMWDAKAKLPAAHCEGRRMPASLRQAMDELLVSTSAAADVTQKVPQMLNAFYSMSDYRGAVGDLRMNNNAKAKPSKTKDDLEKVA